MSLPDLDTRPAYVALLWTGDTKPKAERLVREIAARWPLLRRQSVEGLELLADPARLGPATMAGADLLLGRTHGARSADALLTAPAGIIARAASLVGGTWGRYLAILRGPGRMELGVLRDPSGALPAYILDLGDLLICASAMPRWLLAAAGVTPTPSKDRIAKALTRPSLMTHTSLVEDVITLPAGALYLRQGADARQLQLWRPVEFAAKPLTDADARAAMRSSVDSACRSLASPFGTVALELSGGLDSAIVLGSLASGDTGRSLACVNFATPYCEGDERDHARAATDRWSVPLLELDASEHELDLEQLRRCGTAIEPMIYGMDFVQEHAMTRIVDELGIGAIFTGQGGDAVFFQFPAVEVALDAHRARGLRALGSATAFDAARRTHMSIWSVWRRMLLRGLASGPGEQERFDAGLLGPAARGAADLPPLHHPWLEGADALAPGKRLQLETLATSQIFYGPTHRGAAVPLIHPLLAQPVLETCLAIPSYELSYGTIDRALARQTFSDRLPRSILDRRGKGEAGNYYGRAVVDAIPFLRSFLLDGSLVAHGLLDADALGALLEEDALLSSPSARLPIVYAAFEAWARHWEL